MIEIVFYAFAVYYWTSVLLLNNDKAGPFPSKTAVLAWNMRDEDTGRDYLMKRPVHFFDHLRWYFGVYTVSRDPDGSSLWIVKDSMAFLWTCPHCLGFWVAFFAAGLSLLWNTNAEHFFLIWFASAGINSFLVRLNEGRYSLPG